MPCLIICASILTPSRSEAFELKRTRDGRPVHWPSRAVRFAWTPTGDAVRDRTLALATGAAAKEWTSRAALAVVAEKGRAGAGLGYSQGTVENAVFYVNGAWQWDDDMLALTFLRYDTNTGLVVDADIAINDRDYTWTDRVTRLKPGASDLENTLTHEFGHALGLAHTDVADATMFPTTSTEDTDKRSLEADDIAGAQALYGALPELSSASLEAGDGSGEAVAPAGCQDARGGGLSGCLFALILCLPWRRRAAGLAAMLLGVVLVGPARADDAGEVLRRADAIAQGRVEQQWVEPISPTLWKTVSVVRVERCWAGACPDTMVLEQPGGEFGGQGLWVPGHDVLPATAEIIVAARAEGARWRSVRGDAGLLWVRGSPEVRALDAATRTRLTRVAASWTALHEGPAVRR